MALIDFKWKLNGVHEVYPELELQDPEFYVRAVYYNAETRIADIEVIFTEGVYPHSRTFSLPVPAQDESLSASNIKMFIQMNFPTAIQISGDNLV